MRKKKGSPKQKSMWTSWTSSNQRQLHEVNGVMLWCAFNSRLNSPTRCELGAAIVALLSPLTINIGIDNATVVKKGNEIIQHLRRQEKEKRYDDTAVQIIARTAITTTC